MEHEHSTLNLTVKNGRQYHPYEMTDRLLDEMNNFRFLLYHRYLRIIVA